MGVLYYLIYNPNHWKRDRHEPFELYRLEQGQYVRQNGNPVWMPELGLGIGTARGRHEGLGREWLYWYDENGQQHPAPEDAIEQERQLREQTERQYQREQALRVQAEQIARTLVVQQLTRRLGELPEATRSQINQLSMLQLETLGEAVLELSSQAELVVWLAQHQ
jgi:hypothetical protein